MSEKVCKDNKCILAAIKMILPLKMTFSMVISIKTDPLDLAKTIFMVKKHLIKTLEAI